MDSSRSSEMTLEDTALSLVETEYWLCRVGVAFPMRPDRGYGLLFADCRTFVLPSPEDAALKFASFFINVEKGRRRPDRPGRSGGAVAVSVMATSSVRTLEAGDLFGFWGLLLVRWLSQRKVYGSARVVSFAAPEYCERKLGSTRVDVCARTRTIH